MGKFLYVLRTINDGAIDWYNEAPALWNGTETLEHWTELSQKTGLTVAEILKDISGFKVVPNEERI